jgi:hypothetical protein
MQYDLLVSEDQKLWVINSKLNRNKKSLEAGLSLFFKDLPAFIILRDPEQDIPICEINVPEEMMEVISGGNSPKSIFEVNECFI